MEFVDPGPAKAAVRSEHWANVVKELRANPGKWALVGEYSPGVATHIRRGKYPAFIPEGTPDPERFMGKNYEVTFRKTEGRKGNLYIRFTG